MRNNHCLYRLHVLLFTIPLFFTPALPEPQNESPGAPVQETTASADVFDTGRDVFQQAPTITIQRIQTYPPGYMRREPMVHRAIKESFYSDNQVKLTDQNSFKMLAAVANYFHTAPDKNVPPTSEVVARVSTRYNKRRSHKEPFEPDKKKLFTLRPVSY